MESAAMSQVPQDIEIIPGHLYLITRPAAWPPLAGGARRPRAPRRLAAGHTAPTNPRRERQPQPEDNWPVNQRPWASWPRATGLWYKGNGSLPQTQPDLDEK